MLSPINVKSSLAPLFKPRRGRKSFVIPNPPTLPERYAIVTQILRLNKKKTITQSDREQSYKIRNTIKTSEISDSMRALYTKKNSSRGMSLSKKSLADIQQLEYMKDNEKLAERRERKLK